jgi:hypothetical protein
MLGSSGQFPKTVPGTRHEGLRRGNRVRKLHTRRALLQATGLVLFMGHALLPAARRGPKAIKEVFADGLIVSEIDDSSCFAALVAGNELDSLREEKPRRISALQAWRPARHLARVILELHSCIFQNHGNLYRQWGIFQKLSNCFRPASSCR